MKKRKRHFVVSISAGPFSEFGRATLMTLAVDQSLRLSCKGDLLSLTLESADKEPLEIAVTTPLVLRCANLEMMKLKRGKRGSVNND